MHVHRLHVHALQSEAIRSLRIQGPTHKLWSDLLVKSKMSSWGTIREGLLGGGLIRLRLSVNVGLLRFLIVCHRFTSVICRGLFDYVVESNDFLFDEYIAVNQILYFCSAGNRINVHNDPIFLSTVDQILPWI